MTNFRAHYYQKIGFEEAHISAEDLLQEDAEVGDGVPNVHDPRRTSRPFGFHIEPMHSNYGVVT